MVRIRFSEQYPPTYMTKHSAAADLCAVADVFLPPLAHRAVPTGVRIVDIDWQAVPAGQLPHLLVRARSGLANKHGIVLLNGVGVIDADYRDEIKVLLWNTSEKAFALQAGDRIAQISLQLFPASALCLYSRDKTRGFGSTG